MFLVFIIPILINEIYWNGEGYITIWGAEDVFSFYGDVLSFIGTCALGALSLYQNYVFKNANEQIRKEERERYCEEKRPIYQFSFSVKKNILTLTPRKPTDTIALNERIIDYELCGINGEKCCEILLDDWNNPSKFVFNIQNGNVYDSNEFHTMKITISFTDIFKCQVEDSYWLLLTNNNQCATYLQNRVVKEEGNQ